MKQIITFGTEAGNNYLYNFAAGVLMPIDAATRARIEAGKDLDNNNLLQALSKAGNAPLWPKDGTKQWVVSLRETSADEVRRNIANLRQVCFEVTTACNLACHYCCYGDGYSTFKNRSQGSLNFGKVKAVLDYVAAALRNPANASTDTRLAISFYGGEPLLNMPLIRLTVGYARHITFRGRRVRFTMTTNATQLARNMDFLAQNNFIVLVSLDGDRCGDRHRVFPDGRESFDAVMQNLRRVRDAYPEWFKTLRFNCVYTDASDVRSIVNFFRSEFGTVPNFSPLHKSDADSEATRRMVKRLDFPEDLEDDEDLLSVNPHVRMAYDFLSRGLAGYIGTEHGLMTGGRPPVWRGCMELNPCGTCAPFGKRMFVDHEGGIHPCEKVCRDSPLGQVLETGEVLLDCKEVARLHNAMLAERIIRYGCDRCYKVGLCTKCLLAGGEGTCDNFCDEVRFREYLAKVVGYLERHPGLPEKIDKNIAVR